MDGEAGEAMPGYVKCIERKKKELWNTYLLWNTKTDIVAFVVPTTIPR